MTSPNCFVCSPLRHFPPKSPTFPPKVPRQGLRPADPSGARAASRSVKTKKKTPRRSVAQRRGAWYRAHEVPDPAAGGASLADCALNAPNSFLPKGEPKSSPPPKIGLSNDCPKNMLESDYLHLPGRTEPIFYVSRRVSENAPGPGQLQRARDTHPIAPRTPRRNLHVVVGLGGVCAENHSLPGFIQRS